MVRPHAEEHESHSLICNLFYGTISPISQRAEIQDEIAGPYYAFRKAIGTSAWEPSPDRVKYNLETFFPLLETEELKEMRTDHSGSRGVRAYLARLKEMLEEEVAPEYLKAIVCHDAIQRSAVLPFYYQRAARLLEIGNLELYVANYDHVQGILYVLSALRSAEAKLSGEAVEVMVHDSGVLLGHLPAVEGVEVLTAVNLRIQRNASMLEQEPTGVSLIRSRRDELVERHIPNPGEPYLIADYVKAGARYTAVIYEALYPYSG